MDIEMGGEPRGALAGVRVLDLTAVVSGPLCAQVLGDFGADVVKVETPIGDISRYLGPAAEERMTGLFAQYNRNKRSVVLDLKQDAARAAFMRLARGADVVLENYRAGVADRLGVGYESLRAENPRIVYLAISGFGTDGPYAAQPAYDTVIQGMSGFAKLLGSADEPRLISNLMADKTSGVTAAYAVIAALFACERTGRGQRVDVPMIDAFSTFLLPDTFAERTFGGPASEAGALDAIYRAWPTADGHVAMLIIEDHQFQALCRAIEREDLIEDERCASLITRLTNGEWLFEVFETELRKHRTADLVERAHRFGAPLGPVHGIDEFLEDPQVRSNRTAFDLESEGLQMRLFRSAPRFSDTPTSVRRAPPRLGEHTAEVLREAGLDEAQIGALG